MFWLWEYEEVVSMLRPQNVFIHTNHDLYQLSKHYKMDSHLHQEHNGLAN